MNENPFNITREEVLELAANKLADRHENSEELEGLAVRIINKRIEEMFATSLNATINTALNTELSRILSEEVIPVDMWGKPTGEPTTIRAALHSHAMRFWNERVNEEGKVTDYYGAKPRHEQLFARVANDEFAKAVKQDIVNLVGAFKDAMVANAAKITKEHIDSLINVKTTRS